MSQTLSSVDTGKTGKGSNKPDNASVGQTKYTYNDLQSEVALIAKGSECWSRWERFFGKYEKGELLCPETGQMIKDIPIARGQERKSIPPLSKNWFICLRNLTEKEMTKMVCYMLSEDCGLGKAVPPYPKVIPGAPSKLAKTHDVTSALLWGERKKWKRYVVIEFDRATKWIHGLIDNDAEKDVNVENWRAFKRAHAISSKTMSNIIETAGQGFFRGHRPWQQGTTREFPSAFQQALQAVVDSEPADAATSHVDFASILAEDVDYGGRRPTLRRGTFQEFIVSSRPEIRGQTGRDWVAVIDFRNVRAGMAGTDSVHNQFWLGFVDRLEEFGFPTWHETNVWVWIADGDRKEQVRSLYDRKLGTSHGKPRESHYHPDPLEGFRNDRHTRGKTVTIFTIVKSRLQVPSLPGLFALEDRLRQYPEVKYGIYENELRMETYLRLLQRLTGAKRSVINILGGRKLMLACQV